LIPNACRFEIHLILLNSEARPLTVLDDIPICHFPGWKYIIIFRAKVFLRMSLWHSEDPIPNEIDLFLVRIE